MQLKQRDEFILELAEIASWYERQRPDLGAKFLDAVGDSCQRILRHPLARPVYKRGTRKYRMADFPFYIFYLVTEETVALLAIVHTSRDADAWLERLD